MLFFKFAGFAALASTVAAQLNDCEAWPFDVTTISSPDGSVAAKFVSLGATLAELYVKDRDGQSLDVVPGYDDPSRLLTDSGHPVFNAIVGRYANRIKNGRFTIPPTRNPPADGPGVYHIPTNAGHNTLHGGTIGWDRRNWTIVDKNATSVTYHHLDTADEGFPGYVDAFVTHSVDNGQLRTQVHATASAQTPIMVTQHVYWNLDGFRTSTQNWNTATILDHTLYVDGSRYLKTDGDGVPTGDILNVDGTALDFRQPAKIGARFEQAKGVCGPDCQGYDNCWIYDKPEELTHGVSLWSDFSGIRLDITTNMPATQVYTSNGLNTPRKAVHGGPGLSYGSHSAVAIEQQGWVDAINNPQWGVDQIYGPGKDFSWSTTYRFSNFAKGAHLSILSVDHE
ncbi:galactose mutarotase-like protein [Dentipellis sp. KUC8613]|nr:galactose mutarotase-like protein [Dentipellis sp. KUC8613]